MFGKSIQLCSVPLLKPIFLSMMLICQDAWAGFFNAHSEINFNAVHGYSTTLATRICYPSYEEACVGAPHPNEGKRYYYDETPPPNRIQCAVQDTNTGFISYILTGSSYIRTCQVKSYYMPEAQPNTECGVGNPILPSSGLKHQKFDDLNLSLAGYTWSRYYVSESAVWGYFMGVGWKHNFETYIDDIRPQGTATHFARENLHASPQSVCDDWVSRKSTYMSGLLNNTTATVVDNQVCEISASGSVVAQLPILKRSGSSTEDGVNTASSIKTISRPDGNTYIFKKQEQGYEEVNGNAVYLKLVDGDFIFTDKNGAEDTFEGGLLVSRKLQSGQVISVVRDAQERIEQLRFGTKILLTVNYNADGQIVSVNNGSRTMHYSYDLFNNLVTAESSGQAATYHYENTAFRHHLTGITDRSGVRFATWAYDTNGRAISSEHAGGKEKHTLDFSNSNDVNDPRTVATNPLNKSTTFHYAVIAGQKRVVRAAGHPSTHCAAASQYTTYYANGAVQTKTDWGGTVTYYELDAYNRVTLRAEGYKWSDDTPRFGVLADPLSLLTPEASLQIVKTCWHSVYAKPAKMIEDGHVTIYDYYDNGNLKSTKQVPADPSNQSCS